MGTRAELEQFLSEAAARPLPEDAEGATQLVMGSGNPDAQLLLLGEAPGVEEDQAGKPFVGRAGKLLDRALEEAGIPRDDVYITNTVHWRPTARKNGKLVNRPPRVGEVKASEPWRSREIEIVDPEVIVCLGSVAGSALLGNSFKLTDDRGKVFEGPGGRPCIVTYHPAYLLRLMAFDDAAYEQAWTSFVEDLRRAKELASQRAAARAS